MFCKYCGHESKDAKTPCDNCKKNGFDFNQNGYGNARELLNIFKFLEAEKDSFENAVTPEIIDNNPYRKQNDFNDTSIQKEKQIEQTIQQPLVQDEQPFYHSEQIQNNSNIMPNQYIPTTPEQNSELQKSKSKFFIIPVVLIALAAIITIGFAASKLFATKDKDSESTTETTTITTTETAATESYSEAVSESTTATTTTTTTTTTIASGENAYDFIDMHKNEDMRLTPWSSENAAIDNENYGEILEEYINNWLDNGESYRIINRPTKEKSKSVLDNNNKIIYNNIETSGAGIKLNNEYYNTVWSNINNNQNYGWLLYDIEDSRGNIEGDINNLNDSNTLELIIDNVKYNITYHKNEKTVGKQFDMIYSDRVEGYLYIRNVQDNIYENNSGYYVIIHLKNNGNVDNVLLYMDQNNNLYPIKYLLTENLDRIKIISKSDENEEYLQTEPYNNNYYNNYSNGYYNNPNNNNSTSQEPIVTNISHESATEPPIANPSNSDNSINESNDNITGD